MHKRGGAKRQKQQHRETRCTRTSPLPLLPSGPGGIGGIASRGAPRNQLSHLSLFPGYVRSRATGFGFLPGANPGKIPVVSTRAVNTTVLKPVAGSAERF